MKTFLYTGPNSGATIEAVEYMFWNGKEISLPEDNQYVKTLIAQGYLKERPETPGKGIST